MPITSTHPIYQARITQWTRIRDFYLGEDQVKSKGRVYLPQLVNQSEDEYSAYKLRALFYSIIAKSASGMVGMMMSNKAAISGDVSSSEAINELIASTLLELSLQGRCGVLVDFAGETSPGSWPYASMYPVESIINWNINGTKSFIVLREQVYVDNGSDKYDMIAQSQYRELCFVDGMYCQRTYNAVGELIASVIPEVGGRPLDYLPFVTLSVSGQDGFDVKPTMLDVANVNLSHYLTGADLEHGRHFTGLPTPIILGAESDQKIYLGSSEVIVIPTKGSDAKFLEFTGQGLASLEKALKEKEDQMVTLSAKAIQNVGNGSESSSAINLRFQSETASLRTIVDAAEIGINNIAALMSEFVSLQKPVITLSRSFMDSQMTADDATKWFELYLAGGVSKNTLASIFMSGRVYPDGTDVQSTLNDIIDKP